MSLLGLFRLCRRFHPRQQFFFAWALAERFFLGSMCVVLNMFRCIFTQFRRSCGFVVHNDDLLFGHALARDFG